MEPADLLACQSEVVASQLGSCLQRLTLHLLLGERCAGNAQLLLRLRLRPRQRIKLGEDSSQLLLALLPRAGLRPLRLVLEPPRHVRHLALALLSRRQARTLRLALSLDDAPLECISLLNRRGLARRRCAALGLNRLNQLRHLLAQRLVLHGLDVEAL